MTGCSRIEGQTLLALAWLLWPATSLGESDTPSAGHNSHNESSEARASASAIEMDATVAGRPAPRQLRVLSVFEREDADAAWRLAARSTTPVRTPPRKGPERSR